MPTPIEFLFDFGSPATYLAHHRLTDLVARTGAQVDYVPVLLGGIFKATGNASPVTVPAKGRYMFADLARFATRHGIELRANPHFPINTIQLMRIATALRGGADFMPFTNAVFDAMWREPRNLGDADELRRALDAAELDSARLIAAGEAADAKAELKTTTEAAIARGVFGAPTFFVGETMFFGQDRLDWVEAAAA